ncbi:MAG: helix-turn-helix domain-containing protein [Bacteroidales bacterium]|nr:helix-turn-helix domain-containing protein [Lachnoclostridium sp.]MCM1383168.1 helix-turn-helix domain-containing protein [Lachnoclostridium sp.]MCM1464606.1 helix-turn-helix domain-containing protein [Bacteroidales bacterium]
MNSNEEAQYCDTTVIRDEISKCEDIAELRERILPMLKSREEQWAKKINEIIAESGLTKSKFADISGISRVAVNKWCNGAIPKNRETFLRIGMAAGYGLEKMNRLLQRYGQYPALYSKSLEDCVCIFVLHQNYGRETLTKYHYILNKIKENLIKSGQAEQESLTTELFDAKLSDIKKEDDLERFISENSAVFATAYHKLYAYVKMHIMANYQDYGGSVFELAQRQGWSSSLRQCVSAIRQNKWYPTRNKIISLGLHLSMDHDQIDEMLGLAHMEPLCAKNVFESVIMFILDDASLNNMLDAESEEYDPDELCRYARGILKDFNLPEVEKFITELPEMDDDDTW